jgi:hypothetical protein
MEWRETVEPRQPVFVGRGDAMFDLREECGGVDIFSASRRLEPRLQDKAI